MDAHKRMIISDILSKDNLQFIVPIYQREYKWTLAESDRIVHDILSAGTASSEHFIGSIVYQYTELNMATPALVAIVILTGLILFLPQSILEKMNLNELPELWNQIIGVVFLLCTALIVTIIVFSVIASVTSKHRYKRMRENLKKKYQDLSPRQKAIILQVLRSEDKSIELDKNSGDTVYLVNNLFLHIPNQYVTIGWNNEMILKYVPQPWLLELYNEEPKLFQ